MGPRRYGQPKENKHRLIEPQDVLVVQATDISADLGLRDRSDPVHHKPASGAQSVALVRLHGTSIVI
jgi:hypothetical protein